jgi:glycosyltransferase involved in cell wall biosynthesis
MIMAALPTITLVTPSFNQAEFLETTIRSVLAQNYPRLEYMVLDAGSTDGSVDVIRSYASRLTYWRSHPDHGQGAAVIEGWRRGSGALVSWINSDDVLLEGSLEAVGRAFSDDRDLYYGDDIAIDRAGIAYHYSLKSELPDWVLRNDLGSPGQPGTFYARRLVERVGYFDCGLRYAMEYDLVLRMMSAGGRAHHLRAPVAALRHHEATKTATSAGALTQECDRVSARVVPPLSRTLWPRRLGREFVRVAMLARYARAANSGRLALKRRVETTRPNITEFLAGEARGGMEAARL